MGLKNEIKKIMQFISPAYRVALRNEKQLISLQKQIKNIEKENELLSKTPVVKEVLTTQQTIHTDKEIQEQLCYEDLLKQKEIEEYQLDEKSYNREYDFKFSIIMAVYNVDLFLDEAIESVVNQNIGFKDNVQLILVDDGSADKSGDICDKYAKLYPNNIIVIHKENGGVSSARNAGLVYAKGKYLNFMDSDDKLSLNTLWEVYMFFEGHYFQTDVVVIPFEFFDAKEGFHTTHKALFTKGTRIINLQNEYKCVLMATNRAFIKSRLKDIISYDENLILAEDSKEIQKILLLKQKVGVVDNVKYYYRKRSIGSPSAIDSSHQKKEYYINVLKYFSLFLINECINNYDEIPLYVQFTIMYDLKWKFKIEEVSENVLNENELLQFKTLLGEVLQHIEDKIIIQQENIWNEHRVFILNFKYGEFAKPVMYNNDIQLVHNETKILWLSSLYSRIDFISFGDNKLIFEGRSIIYNCTEDEKISVYAKVNGVTILCENVVLNQNKYSINEFMYRLVGFKLVVPISIEEEQYDIDFYNIYHGQSVLQKTIVFGKFSPLGKEYKSSYFYKDGRVLTFSGHTLIFKKCGKKGRIKRELAFLNEIKEIQPSIYKKVAFARIYSQILNLINKKQIWLISDRFTRADDNGKAFFEYLQKLNSKEIQSYFIINKNVPDFKIIKKIGKVIDNNSYTRWILHLCASNIISSAGDEFVCNPFDKHYTAFRDLLQTQKFVFLQHGVTKDDISNWLNKYSKNIKMLSTVSQDEYKSFLLCDYYYTTKEISLSGFPRHDLLYEDSKKCITIMQTWRRFLAVDRSSETGIWELIPDFKESEYYKFYNTLINDEKLINIAQKLEYTINFMPHPNITSRVTDFEKNEYVNFICFDKPYKEVFAESDLVITDYSSAVFDFAYLRKPIMYSQFDKDLFFDGSHIYKKGYFDYETMGFGEVEYDLESTINRIIEYMENGCKLKDKYRARIDDFFEFNDKNNCKRTYEAIISMGDN